MKIEVHECPTQDDLVLAFSPISHYFGGDPSAEDLKRIAQVFDYRRAIYATADGEPAGGAAAHAFELSVPGGTVPAAGVTIVGVRPTHRRRGILRHLMRKQLDQVRSWGEPVAFLWASEETIYGRFGYGWATWNGRFELTKADSQFAQPVELTGQMKLLNKEDAYEPISTVYEKIRPGYPGMYSRSENWWKLRRMHEPAERKGSEMNRAVLYIDGEPEAYALYRIRTEFKGGENVGEVRIIEALATSPEATAQLWRFLLDIDWSPKVQVDFVAVDHPLHFLLARPSRMKMILDDALWVRLVDVEDALRRRTISQAEPVVLEIADAFCPENEGRYRVGRGEVARTTDDPDLSMDVSALGSVYLGGNTFADLNRGCRVRELTSGAVERADAVLPRDRAPFCPEVF